MGEVLDHQGTEVHHCLNCDPGGCVSVLISHDICGINQKSCHAPDLIHTQSVSTCTSHFSFSFAANRGNEKEKVLAASYHIIQLLGLCVCKTDLKQNINKNSKKAVGI